MIDFQEEILQYKKYIGKLDTLFTILCNNITKEQVIENLQRQLKKVKNLSGSTLKRKIVNNRLCDAITKLDELKTNICNHIVFVGEEIDIIEIPKKNIKMLEEYHVDKYFFTYGNEFAIDMLIDIFYNMDFFHIMKIQKNHIDYYRLNKYKQKLVRNATIKSIDELNGVIKDSKEMNGLVNGITNINDIHKLDNNWDYVKKSLSHDEIIEYFEKKLILHAHKLTKDTLNELSNPNKEHLFVFGKFEDIQKAIESYQLKELYCHPEIWEKLKKNVDESCLNFEIIKVASLGNGDMGDVLLKTYNGAFGISYY